MRVCARTLSMVCVTTSMPLAKPTGAEPSSVTSYVPELSGRTSLSGVFGCSFFGLDRMLKKLFRLRVHKDIQSLSVSHC